MREPALKNYTVKKGDSFSKIAMANGVSINAIAEANSGVDSRQLRVGQVLQIPVASEAQASPTSHDTSAIASSNQQIYVVNAGDTLSQIANAHGTTVGAIRAINELRTDRITVGQKLKLPLSNPPIQSAKPRQSTATNAAVSLGAP